MLIHWAEVSVQEFKCLSQIDFMAADEPFDGTIFRQFELSVIKVLDLGKLEPDLLVGTDRIEVPALDHERTRSDQGRHFGIAIGTAQTELKDVRLRLKHVAVATVVRSRLPDPFVEITGNHG